MIASVHPMLFLETYREVFTQKWLAPDELTLPSVHSMLKKMLKCSGFLRNLVENLISFPTSTRSS
jgi:hypothetical protein